MRGLEVDGVEAADYAVVGEGHLGCDVGGGVGGLEVVRLDGYVRGVGWTYVLGECGCGN